MKNWFIKFSCWIVLSILLGCNNSDNIASVSPGTDTLSREQLLKNDLKQYPDSTLLVENLVQYYREAGNYDGAIATINDRLKLDSNNSRLWDIKATLHFEDTDTAGAVNAFEKAVEISADPQYLISLGTIYAETKNPNALLVSDALLESKAKAEKEAWFIKGLYYSYIKEKAKAISYFDKSLAVSYTYMSAYTEKALALYDLGKYTDALAVLDKAVTLQNNFDEGHYYRGRCLEKLNKPMEAINAYQMALQYDPQYTEAKDALSRLGVKTN